MDRLSKKVAIVAGAGSSGPGWGNGKAAAVLFAREGASVVAVDRNEDAVAETVDLIQDEGGESVALTADITDPADCQRIVATALEQYGHLDVLLNNVGIVKVGGVVDLPKTDWDTVMNVNLTGFYLMCKAAVPALLENGSASIVNVGSIAGIRYLGVPYVAYAATKAGVLGLTQSTALEYASRGIRCNAVLPGLMNTPMIVDPLKDAYAQGDVEKMIEKRDAQCPMGHMGDAFDVAHAALFLASDDARYITGTQLVVDGGLTAKC